MKINLPRITRPLPLSEYLPEAGEQCLQVWVNPPLFVLARLAALERAARESSADPEKTGQALMSWYAECWSQHPDPATHWTVDEVSIVVKEQPDFYLWTIRRTFALIAQYQAEQKKA